MNARLRSVAIVAAVVLLDRITKLYIRTYVSPMALFPVIPGFFNIVHTENPGAAFGFMADLDFPWRRALLVTVSVVVMAIIGSLLFRVKSNSILQTGLALVLGGALGNAWDRLTRGMVTDFLQFFFGTYEFPSFNMADSAITIGAALLLIDLWRTKKPE
jgi:signal peptidase II